MEDSALNNSKIVPKVTSVNLVLSVYNEAAVLDIFWKKLNSVIVKMPFIHFELIWVNDGSKDESDKIIRRICASNKNAHISFVSIEFSKNYGHEAAMIAGIDHCTRDVIICMDTDGQHPPEKIGAMIKAYEEGNDIITMSRKSRGDKSGIGSKSFYKLLNYMSNFKFDPSASDFFLISKRAGDILKTNFRERNRFLRGYIQIIGFNKKTVPYDAPDRMAGSSKYSFGSLFYLAGIAFYNFSNRPLYFSIFISFIFLFISIVVILYSLYNYFFSTQNLPSGYTTLIIFQSVGFGLISLSIAILSIYFGKSIEEIKERPLYIIKNISSNK